jgi:fructokinase
MLDVVCFGEILWDVFEAQARGREPIARTFRRELGGAPANVATGLARLGVRAAIVGGVGRDRFGDALRAHLEADGVDSRFVIPLPSRTGLAFVVRDGRGEPSFIFYRHESADLAIRARHITPAMGRARWALVGTSTLMTRDLAGATARFLEVAEKAGAAIVVDLNVRAHLWSGRAAMLRAIVPLVGRAALVKASDADLDALAGRTNGLRWLERFAPGATWLVTRGAGRASAIGSHGQVHAPAARTRCVDATGAGDAFIAGALATLVAARAMPGSAAWSEAKVWTAALRVGHMMGKKAVSAPGAVRGLTRLGRPRSVIEAVRRSFA